MKVKHKYYSLISWSGRDRNGCHGWLNCFAIGTILISIVLLVGCAPGLNYGHPVEKVHYITVHYNVPAIDLANTGIKSLAHWTLWADQKPGLLERAGVVQISFSCNSLLKEVRPDKDENQYFKEYDLLMDGLIVMDGLCHIAYAEPKTAIYKSFKERCLKELEAIEMEIDGRKINLSENMLLYMSGVQGLVILEVGTHTVTVKDTRTGKTRSVQAIVDKDQPFIKSAGITTKNFSGWVVGDIRDPARLEFWSYKWALRAPFSLHCFYIHEDGIYPPIFNVRRGSLK